MTEHPSFADTTVNSHKRKAYQFLADAQLLESKQRYDSAVSRCYYALYHFCIDLLETSGHFRPGWNHGAVRKLI